MSSEYRPTIEDYKEMAEAYRKDYEDANRLIAAIALSQPDSIVRVDERAMIDAYSDDLTIERWDDPKTKNICIMAKIKTRKETPNA